MSIARRLNREGIHSAERKQWTQGTVRRILSNPLYCGKIARHDGVFKGAHEPIVSDETWNAAAKMRNFAPKRKNKNPKGNLRGSVAGSNNNGGRQPKGRHLLTKGLLRCGSCGAAMVPRTESRKEGQRELYMCLGRHRDIESCEQGSVERATVDEAILRELSIRYLDLEATRERLRTYLNNPVAGFG